MPVAPHVFDSLIDPWRGPTGQAALYRQIAQGDEQHTDEFRSRLAELRCPTLILWGEDDSWIPVQRGQKLAELIPRSTWHTTAGAGHVVQEDAPGQILRYLLPFLAAQVTHRDGRTRLH
jgi:pimeloyl-ACP methyl ester carboxylesterase